MTEDFIELEKLSFEASKRIIEAGIEIGEIGIPEIQEYSVILGHLEALRNLQDPAIDEFKHCWETYAEETHHKLHEFYMNRKIRIYPNIDIDALADNDEQTMTCEEIHDVLNQYRQQLWQEINKGMITEDEAVEKINKFVQILSLKNVVPAGESHYSIILAAILAILIIFLLIYLKFFS